MEWRRRVRERRTGLWRTLTLLSLGVATTLLLAACGGVGLEESRPYTTTTPESPTARDIQGLYKLVFWMALVVFLVVQTAIVYTALRFRRTSHGADRPAQIHGNKRLEILWTVIPAIVLLVILIPSITTMYDFDAAAEEGDLVVDIYARQWWWEIHYGKDARGDELGVITGNEIHIPVGQDVIFRLHSNNVIHSFWVPQLSGKTDVIPGHINEMSITATEPGEYYGECAEFCGAQHAWMRFKVVADPVDEFYTWVNQWRTATTMVGPAATSGELSRVPDTFGLCLACHQINGTNANVAPVGIESPPTSGPNLTLFACRETLAAGLLVNNEENLRAWLRDPGAIKEDNWMATVIQPGTLSEEQIDELVEYLYTLRPAEGCAGDAVPAVVPDTVAIPAA